MCKHFDVRLASFALQEIEKLKIPKKLQTKRRRRDERSKVKRAKTILSKNT
jgi:hypothetical protein